MSPAVSNLVTGALRVENSLPIIALPGRVHHAALLRLTWARLVVSAGPRERRAPGGRMTFDHAVALSFVPELPRAGLTERLLADDPHLIEAAEALLDTARRQRALARRRGVHVVPWNAPEFPPSLLVTPDCPPALWFRGSLACLEAPCVAIVGSRAASAVAIEAAERLGGDLAGRGITVVSGLARGVDSAAHRGALRSGRTAAILGSGVDRVYPAEHEELADRVAAAGIVASE